MAANTLIVSALVRRGGRILLVKQQGPDDAAPAWMLPGGRVERGESLYDALRREMAEETGLRLVGTVSIAFAVELHHDGERYLAITFAAEGDGSLEPADPDGYIRAVEWVGIEDALSRLASAGWYDCTPLARFLSGEAPEGAVYAGTP